MIDEKDFIVKTHKYASGKLVNQRFFRAYCDKCGVDKEVYLLRCQAHRLCGSCRAKARIEKHGNPMQGHQQDCTKFRPTYPNVHYDDFKLITTNVGKIKRRYKMHCSLCNKDRGYLAHNEATRPCLECYNKSKIKRSPEQKKIYRAISSNINARFAARKLNKDLGCFRWLPYTIDDLIKHLESKFAPWMNWDNYGLYNPNKRTWQIDHIKADANHTYSSVRDQGFKDSWALSNLQPLDSMENAIKADKY